MIENWGGASVKRYILLLGLLVATAVPVLAAAIIVPNTAQSLERGRELFASRCAECHGRDGRGHVEVIADAGDLTEPLLYRTGSTDEAIDSSIRDGAGAGMPAYGNELKNPDDVGHLRNYIKSLWPADKRPPIEK